MHYLVNLGVFSNTYIFIAAGLIAVTAALLSPFIVLKNQALIADGLAHTAFFGIALGVLLSSYPVYISMLVTVLFSIVIQLIIENTKIDSDSAIGVIEALGYSLGILIISLWGANFKSDLGNIINGSLATMEWLDFFNALIIFCVALSFILWQYRRLVSQTFDPSYAKFNHTNQIITNYGLSVLVAVLISVGMRMMGTLLISALILFPVLISVQFRRNFIETMLIGVAVAILTVAIAAPIQLNANIAPSPIIVLVYFSFLVLALIFAKIRKISKINKQKNLKKSLK